MFALSNRLRQAGAAAVMALALAIIVPAGAHADGGCPQQEAAQTFLPWADPAWYVPAPDGGLERKAAQWTLLGGATVVDGNEPYFVGGANDRRSLDLPRGSAATTPPMCLAFEHPTVRFFARNTGAPDSTLRVSIEYRDRDGSWQSLVIGVVGGDGTWAPTPPLPITVNLLSLLSDQQAAFRFAPVDNHGAWSIDDVYVDPYGKG